MAWTMRRKDCVRALSRAGRNRFGALSVLMIALCAACTRMELEHKADSYNAAVAESTNESILLNAVRASQRAPMSFTGLGDVVATPIVSGAAEGTFGFDPFGLTTYSLKPAVNVGAGFSTFNMSNLNRDKFIGNIQKPIKKQVLEHFEALGWPSELLELMFIANYQVSRESWLRLGRTAEAICRVKMSRRAEDICHQLEKDRAEIAARCPANFYSDPEPVVKIHNGGRDFCTMARFQLFLRTLRLQQVKPFRTPYLQYTTRSAQGLLYYLGELIAAQNYSTNSFMPHIYIGGGIRREAVDLFVVKRGAAGPGEAAVRVNYRGESFFIPMPDLGSPREARSLQVLDLVTQVIALQTAGADLPKANTIGLISIR